MRKTRERIKRARVERGIGGPKRGREIEDEKGKEKENKTKAGREQFRDPEYKGG